MKPTEIIRKKRDGASLSKAEIAAFVRGAADESWADYQLSALLMAMFLNGLDQTEAQILTDEMLRSGEILDFSDLEMPVADKHSTGGVGDKTSLIIAPLAAACGVHVPMISGRGLGHTGGTLDKLEAIQGYNVNLSLSEFKQTIKKCGFAMTGQTAEIAPADRKLYALRDATATVESIPLIVASIMSKKMAEGLNALVLDVKTGAGAFMPAFEKSKELARALVATGTACGVKTEAVISDMNQPLGLYIGNAHEVFECLCLLRGDALEEKSSALDLSVLLTARMLVLTGVCENLKAAREKCEKALHDGSALEKFGQNVELQGGDPRICDKPRSLLADKLLHVAVRARQSGFIAAVDAKAIGEAVSLIGGGRSKVDDLVDAQVSFACLKKVGDKVRERDDLGVINCRTQKQANSILEKLRAAFVITEDHAQPLELIKEIVD